MLLFVPPSSRAEYGNNHQCQKFIREIRHWPGGVPTGEGFKESPLKGLQIRNGKYYAYLKVDGGDGPAKPRRFTLLTPEGVPVSNLTEAIKALAVIRVARASSALPTAGKKPSFRTYAETYLSKASTVAKKPGTVMNERKIIALWQSHLGSVIIDKIKAPMIASFREKRLTGGLTINGKLYDAITARTANLDVVILRNVLKSALLDGYLRFLPQLPRLKQKPPAKRSLLTLQELQSLVDAAYQACQRNGDQLADYLCFLAFSGAREKESLRIRWEDIDLIQGHVTIGADGDSKNGMARKVQCTGPLLQHLKEMSLRRAPDSSWLFPSPRRGDKDIHAESFRDSLLLAREAAGLPWVGFHDPRHFFCSWCVMSGIDYMTIAAWAGHQDGGILIGKVYGHLADEHKQQAAARVTFGLRALPSVGAVGA